MRILDRTTISRDLDYARRVEAWALAHLDRTDLTYAQRRSIERELGTALRMREQLEARAAL